MFLGAVSAGASVFVHDGQAPRPTDRSAIFNPSEVANDSQGSTPSEDKSTDDFRRQNTIQRQQIAPVPSASLYGTVPLTTNIKTTGKKNPVAEVLRGVTNSAIFQNQADLLDKLQNKAAETVNGLVVPVDPTGVTGVIPVLPLSGDQNKDSGHGEQTPQTTETPPADNTAQGSADTQTPPPAPTE